MTTKEINGILGNYEESQSHDAPSNKRFGLTVGAIFSALAGLSYLSKSPRPAAAFVIGLLGFLLIVAGALFPASLSMMNRRWMQLGLLLGKVTTPIIMAIIFFAFVSPLALIMRVCGSRPLNLKFEPEATTYWHDLSRRKFNPESLKRQF